MTVGHVFTRDVVPHSVFPPVDAVDEGFPNHYANTFPSHTRYHGDGGWHVGRSSVHGVGLGPIDEALEDGAPANGSTASEPVLMLVNWPLRVGIFCSMEKGYERFHAGRLEDSYPLGFVP